MNCSHCVRKATEALLAVAGVDAATVDLPTRRATVRWRPGACPDTSALRAALRAAGYEARPIEAMQPGTETARSNRWRVNWVIGLAALIPMIAGEWLAGAGERAWFQWLSLVLASVVQVVVGGQFYRGAWRQLRAGRSNMDTLVALGSTTAFAYSLWALVSARGGHIYFMEAAAIITLVSLGHWLEARVSARAADALRALMQLAPATARRLAGRGSGREALPGGGLVEEEVPVEQLRPGDRVLLRPGDRVPVDGTVEEGGSAVDEAMLTGESVPVDKLPGHTVFAGTTNLNGRLIMRVSATGEATALAQIIAAVQRAQASRANIQRLADRISNVFVPVVVLVALVAGLLWGLAPDLARSLHEALAPFLWSAHPPAGAAAAFVIAAAVLIIACPCAMGLATPAAIMAGANAAAARGILIRDGVALEKAGRITAVVFDKTGTLTLGRPRVVATWKASEAAGAAALAAAMAHPSTHPLSRAVEAFCRAAAPQGRSPAADVQVDGWREVPGAGIEARVVLPTAAGGAHNQVVRLGSLRWLREHGVGTDPAAEFEADLAAQGATLVGLAAGNALLQLFALQDPVKPGAAAVVGQLQRQGLAVWLVTGDNPLTAAALARQAGIPAAQVCAAVPPGQKAALVGRLQQAGLRVAFVGDGINDAPALEQADLGIAVARASDVAREAADIVLLRSEIEAVPEALGLARATLRVIRQNLFWAFFYNAVGVPLAALGFLGPVVCAVAMGASDLLVLGNALRLRHWREGAAAAGAGRAQETV